MRKLWRALLRPSARWSVLALVVIGIVVGIALIVLPHVGIKLTSSTEFCVSCHSMQPVYEEYKQSAHFQNASGGHCCKVSDEAAFCLIQRPYISKTLLT
ncbi:NapC/NirT family cytochrome c, partial [Citrobacter freundii]